jgi:exopolysaccharide biosynthesis polyprenyl glycosylphosphotransferase
VSAPTIPQQTTFSVVAAEPARRRFLSLPIEQRATKPAWVWLAASDCLIALLTLSAVSNLLGTGSLGSGEPTTRLGFVLIASICLVASLIAKRVYPKARRHIAPTPADDLMNLESAIAMGALLTLALGALVPSLLGGALRPGVVAIAFGGCAVVLPVARALTIGLRGRSAGTRPARVVVVGTGTIASDVASRLSRSRHVELVGFVDDDPVDGQTVLGDLASLPSICQLGMVDRVLIAFSRSHPARTTDLIRSLVGNVAVDVVPRYFELTGWEASFQDLDGLSVISLDGGSPGPLGRFAKRLFDLLGATMLLIALAPVLLAAVVAVKVTSPGPALFRQSRLGRDRRPFEILKLRTMREPGPSENALGDRHFPGPLTDLPEIELRVTPLGHLLRRLGLDELPQLLNVLRGDMSLVGPRPFVPEECTILPEWVGRRFEIRPGLTGLWQMCGQHDLRFEELCRLDCQYVASWSLGADVRILARTPGRLMRGGGGGASR